MMAVGGAVLGSLQFGYNTGVINAPQKVSAAPSLAYQHQPVLLCTVYPHTLCLLGESHLHQLTIYLISQFSVPEQVRDSWLWP